MKKIFLLMFLSCILMNLINAQTNVFPTSGNVGIGTSSPAAKVDILPANGNALLIRPFGTAANQTGMIQFRELTANGTNYAAFRAPDALSSNLTFRLPTSYGSNGQVLGTSGSGVLTWITPAVGAGGANTALSNLAATSVNQALLPNSTNTRDLGSASRGWRNIYTTGAVYLDGMKVLANPGTSCIAVGRSSLQSATTATMNVSIGDSAMFSSQNSLRNTIIGFKALYSASGTNGSTAVGYQAMYNSSSNAFNTAIGFEALYNNTVGFENTAVGKDALHQNSTGNYNVAIGVQALYNGNGDNNVAIGKNTMIDFQGGANNTAVGGGANAGNVAGNYNSGFGASALQHNTGSYNTALGASAGPNFGTNPWSLVSIGFNAGKVGSNSNTIEIGSTNISWIGGQTGWFLYSDKRIKDNVQNNVPGLSFINKLNPVTYNLNVHRENAMLGIKYEEEWEGMYDIEQITQTGFLAQEVEEAAKACEYDFSGVVAPNGNAKLYSINYSSFVVPLVKAVQELNLQQNEKFEKLKVEIEALKSLLSETQLKRFEELQATDVMLGQNVPNPFNKSTTISYFIPQGVQKAFIYIYDASGTQVFAMPVDSFGEGSVSFPAGSLAAGNYSYQLVADGRGVASKVMTVTE